MSIEMLTLFMFGTVTIALVLGLPLTFALGGIAVAATLMMGGPDALVGIIFNTFGTMWAITYVAIPLFVIMGIALERSGLAEDLYRTLYLWSGALRGGLAIATVTISAIFAAMAGVAAAAVVSMGLIGLPAMLKRKYDKNLAIGSILASGPLGILIPPSVPMVILGTTTSMSIGRIFAGGVVPGILITAIFIAYVGFRCLFQHHLAPALPQEERGTLRDKLISLKSVILPALLITAVLGSIFAGIASPTEAAAVGALGAILCAVIYRRFNWQFVKEVSYRSASFTAMIMWITFGAVAFSAVYSGAGVTAFLLKTLGEAQINRWLILVAMELILLFLGCFLEPASMILICAPIFFPIVKALQFDPVWFAILFVMLIMVGYLTPPFGYSIFYLKSVAPPSVSMTDIYRSVTPWIIMMLLAIVLVMLFPQIALWLPNLTKG